MKALFDIPELRGREQDKNILSKSKKKSTTTVKKSGNSLADKIELIKATVESHLGKFADETLIIQDIDVLSDYIDKCIENGICAIDTETTGLDPLVDKIVGVGIYTPGEKTTYIPINHISYTTGQRVKNQLSPEEVGEQVARLIGSDIDMFNATFDVRVLLHGIGTKVKCTWDASLASRCLNENEPQKSLKKLHQKYILKGKEDAFKFDDLFKGINFAYVPIKTGALYAAHDPKITYEYAEYQRNIFKTREDLKDVYWVFKNIEMPLIEVVADMEDTGVAFDLDYAAELHEKYHKLLDEKVKAFEKAYSMYDDEIKEYSKRTKAKFDSPININSVPQLQMLLFDVIGLKGKKDKKTGEPSRSTDEEHLNYLKGDAVVDAILDYRSLSTIVSTFIDKLPECVNKKDGRIHCSFNQYGADTGRFSSKDPNMQNIPSHNKDIRKMFKATDGYVMMSSDYSQQEVKGMAQMCGDEGMIEAFRQGKDFYAQIASVAFNKSYRECLEFQTDDEGNFILDKNGERVTYPEGKERRAQAKSILLGINYGRGAASIAEQLGCSKEKAEKIKNDVFEGFPAIEEFEQQSFAMAEDYGYVTTLWGRKRRLPILTRPDYEFEWKEGANLSDDPLNFDEEVDDEVPDDVIRDWTRKLKNAWGKKKNQVIAQAMNEGIKITDNTKAKADAQRQVVNSRIQGSAADQSKLAMIALYNNERLKELGFRMLIPVHDEIIAECPKENAREVSELFAYVMSNSSGEKFTIPISCDVTVTERWYGESVEI